MHELEAFSLLRVCFTLIFLQRCSCLGQTLLSDLNNVQTNNTIKELSGTKDNHNFELAPTLTNQHLLIQSHNDINRANKSFQTLNEINNINISNRVAVGLFFGESIRSDDSFDLKNYFKLNLTNPIDANLSKIIEKNGPDLRPSTWSTIEVDEISIDVSKRAIKLLHDKFAYSINASLQLAKPVIDEILFEANVSSQCKQAIDTIYPRAKQMDLWALSLLAGWSTFPPIGLFEGTYSDLGSYSSCLNIEENPYIEHAHYCTLTFRPPLPSREKFALIVHKEPKDLINIFNYNIIDNKTNNNNNYSRQNIDSFTDLLQYAQYGHYIYYKLSSCWPIKCSPFDVKSVARVLGRRNYLLQGPVSCFSKYEQDYDAIPIKLNKKNIILNNSSSIDYDNNNKTTLDEDVIYKKIPVTTRDLSEGIYVWKPHFKDSYMIAGIIILIPTIFILSMTICDLILNRIPYVYRLVNKLSNETSMKNNKHTNKKTNYHINNYATDNTSYIANNNNTNNNGNFFMTNNNNNNNSMYNKSSNETNNITTNENVSTFQPYSYSNFSPENAQKMFNSNNMIILNNVDNSIDDCKDHMQQIDLSDNSNNDIFMNYKNRKKRTNSNQTCTNNIDDNSICLKKKLKKSIFRSLIDNCSIVTSTRDYFHVSKQQSKSIIFCLEGIRTLTMIWVLAAHSLMFTNWKYFARSREIEIALRSLATQPLFNGTYVTDSFFLLSGLLSAYTAFKHNQGKLNKFKPIAFLVSRWLRLTPQLIFTSMLFIIWPWFSSGPNWYSLVGENSENCIENWWLFLFHGQAYYRTGEMCNVVTWWISIDSVYYIISTIIILIILKTNHLIGFISIALVIIVNLIYETIQHYQLGIPPNVFSTIPQTGPYWLIFNMSFFWKTYSHTVPYFFGFYTGYLIALKKKTIKRMLNFNRAITCWLLFIIIILILLYSPYLWVIGECGYTQTIATVYFISTPIFWNLSICWIIIACHHGYGSFINTFLSSKVFLLFGRCSYMVYLVHSLCGISFNGNLGILLEPTTLLMCYIIFGNIVTSIIFGASLCIIYEYPWLKAQRTIMKKFGSQNKIIK